MNTPILLQIRERNESIAGSEQLAKSFSRSVLSVPFLYDSITAGQSIDRLRAEKRPLIAITSLSHRAVVGLFQKYKIDAPLLACFPADSKELGDFLSSYPPEDASSVTVEIINESLAENWYPLIDEAACIGCLECVNFCLFGVYAIGQYERPIVSHPKMCKNGCPACSRICPCGAIIFPLFDDPNINGSLPAKKQNDLDDLDRLIDQTDIAV